MGRECTHSALSATTSCVCAVMILNEYVLMLNKYALITQKSILRGCGFADFILTVTVTTQSSWESPLPRASKEGLALDTFQPTPPSSSPGSSVFFAFVHLFYLFAVSGEPLTVPGRLRGGRRPGCSVAPRSP
eukprot:6589157-Prymnesium_polylepis.1